MKMKTLILVTTLAGAVLAAPVLPALAQHFEEMPSEAVVANSLDLARRLRTDAQNKKAYAWAPVTFREAEASLRQAEDALAIGGEFLPEARAAAAAAAAQFQRAVYITERATAVNRAPRTEVEALILDQEAQLARITERLDLEPDFISGMGPVVTQITAAIDRLHKNLDVLEHERVEHAAQIRRLQEEVDTLEARLEAQAAAFEQEYGPRLRELENQEQALSRAGNIFAHGEGEVLLSNGAMVVRLYGITFPEGSAEVLPENDLLLSQLQRVLRMFPEAPVLVVGHTDAQGDDAANLSLSRERAAALRVYLTEKMGLDPARIRSEGRGETEPIASNQTPEGRAKNRRVDFVVSVFD